MILFNLDSLLGGPIVKYSYMWDPVVNIWTWGRHDDSVYNNIGRQKHDPQMTFLNISSQRCWHKRYFPLPATPPFVSQLFSEFQFLFQKLYQTFSIWNSPLGGVPLWQPQKPSWNEARTPWSAKEETQELQISLDLGIDLLLHSWKQESWRQDRITGRAVTLGGNRSRHHGEGVGGRKGVATGVCEGTRSLHLGLWSRGQHRAGPRIGPQGKGRSPDAKPFSPVEGRGGSQCWGEPGLSLEQWGLSKFLQMSAAGPAVFVSPCIGPSSPLRGSHSLGVWLSNF